MKRIKVVMTAALVVATVGGAFAFKAFSPAEVFCKATTSNQCTRLVQFQDNEINGTGTIDPCGDGLGKYRIGSSSTSECPSNSNRVYPVTDL